MSDVEFMYMRQIVADVVNVDGRTRIPSKTIAKMLRVSHEVVLDAIERLVDDAEKEAIDLIHFLKMRWDGQTHYLLTEDGYILTLGYCERVVFCDDDEYARNIAVRTIFGCKDVVIL